MAYQRTKSKIEVYVDHNVEKKIRRIAKKSGRPICEILNHFYMLSNGDLVAYDDEDEYTDVGVFISVANAQRGAWKENMLYSRIPQAWYEELKDKAWELNICACRGKSSGAGMLMGIAATLQLSRFSLDYWTQYFKNGHDMVHNLMWGLE